jgi:hypothetical protein
LYIYTEHFPFSGILKADLPQHHMHFASKNEWLNFNEHIITMEEKEPDESDITEFTKLVEQHEQT